MALSRHHAAISRPLSVDEIVKQAENFEFSSSRPMKGWLRSAQMLLTEAAICEQDHNLQTAYLYFYRHAVLVLQKLPQHPEYKDPQSKVDLSQAQKTVQNNLAKLEQWKPGIKQNYARYLKAVDRRNAEKKRIHDERLKDEQEWDANDDARRVSIDSADGAFDNPTQSLNANENRQLAVDLAHRELRRRDATKQSTRQAGISPGTVASRRRGVVLDAPDLHESDEGLGGVSESIREAGRHLQQRQSQPSRQIHANQPPATSSYHYPSVPAKEESINWNMQSLQPTSAFHDSGPPPMLPGKQPIDERLSRLNLQAPLIPPKSRNGYLQPSPSVQSPASSTAHSMSKYTFEPTAFTEAGTPLRPVLLPPELRMSFLNLAHSNTLRNLETCGILCGTVISNALFINHLVIPDQVSTSDTCDTTEEGDNRLFDFCDSNELLVCGWIHTHPSQSCFLSSRDLHTSSGYQVMLPEAIAIVCAPKSNPDWGIFRLTDPPGLKHILHCEQRSLFHPHTETNLYTDAVKPGHVVEGPGLKFQVVDFRKR